MVRGGEKGEEEEERKEEGKSEGEVEVKEVYGCQRLKVKGWA